MSGIHFHASGIRAIDSPHKITYMHTELVSFEPFLARFLSLFNKGCFFLGFLRTFPVCFIGYFLTEKSVFDAVLFTIWFLIAGFDSKMYLRWLILWNNRVTRIRDGTYPSEIPNFFVTVWAVPRLFQPYLQITSHKTLSKNIGLLSGPKTDGNWLASVLTTTQFAVGIRFRVWWTSK